MSASVLPRLPARDHAVALALGAGYFVVAAFTVRVTRFDGGVAFVWAATALLFANLVLTPTERWASRLATCWLASVAVTWLYGLGPIAAVPLGCVNIAEAAGGAWLLKRFCPQVGDFRSIVEVGAFIAIAGVVVPGSLAFLAAACATAVKHTDYWSNWANWYTSHALGAAIFAPLLLLSAGAETSSMVRTAGRRGVAEAVALLATVAVTTAVVFGQTRLPLLFLPFLPMMIAVFRLGRFGAVMSSAIIALIGTALTIRGLGPVNLIVGSSGTRAQFFQFYLATAVLMVLPAAAELKRRKTLLTALQETSALQQLILDRTSDIIMRLELDGTIAYVSPSVHRVGGYTPAHLIGRKPHQLIHADDVEAVVRAHVRALAAPSETVIVEYRAQREDGGTGWFETHTRATVDEAGRPTGAVSIIREITRRKQEVAALEHRADTDALTGLVNRGAFDTVIADAVARGQTGCIALFDLDRFKAINDRHGHAVGDAVLKKFAEVAGSVVRGGDIVARFGGEEFVALIDGASLDEASAVCERVRLRFEALELRDDKGAIISATVSAGLARIDAGATVDEMLKAADAALYRSKAAGRNRLTLAA